ncbi:MAG TPA: IS3 family transposase [Terriglobia bacterium]|jgi:transposase InsO family protein|nr:IS3 family transposase [Terriglobia bacterium]
MPLQGSLSIERMCQLAGVSRRSFYRSLKERQPAEEEMEVRSAIQQIALEHRRRYGYPRITAELRRRGMQINHKRVARIMREDNLLGIQPKRFVVTTNSNHKLEVYLNLARRMKVTGINQLWVADIPYIRLKTEFVYLAVILDAYSRKVVGWALDRTMTARLTIRALEQAIENRHPQPGLVHHSDRGFQYAGADYIALMEKHGMVPSMSRPANPYDNASCESFIKTLKREEIYANQYNDLSTCGRTSRSSSRSITIASGYTLRWATARRKNSSARTNLQLKLNLEAQRSSFLRTTVGTTKNQRGFLNWWAGKGTPMPSPSPNPIPCWKIQKCLYTTRKP